MTTLTDRFADPLEPLGVAAGALLVLVGLATIAGMPWTVKGDALASLLQVLGALGAVGIGAGLAWLSRTD